MLSHEQISKYQEIYRKRFNRDLSREEALEQGLRLIRLIECVYKPKAKEKGGQIKPRDS